MKKDYIFDDGPNETFYVTFRGNFKDGLLEGFSKVQFVNTDKNYSNLNCSIEGNWLHGMPHSTGIKIKFVNRTMICKWNFGLFSEDNKCMINYNDGAYYCGKLNNGLPNGYGKFCFGPKPKKFNSKKIVGIHYVKGTFVKSWDIFGECEIEHNSGSVYKGTCISIGKDQFIRHGFGITDSINKICNCCGKRYLDKYNIKPNLLTSIQKKILRRKTQDVGYWKDNKLMFECNKPITKCVKCHKEPQIICVTCKMGFCKEHFHHKHNKCKVNKHQIIRLDFKELQKEHIYSQLNLIKKEKGKLMKKVPPKEVVDQIEDELQKTISSQINQNVKVEFQLKLVIKYTVRKN